MNLLKTFFYSLKKSVSEPKYYKDVAKASFGFSFKYLLFLLFIFTIIRGVTLGGKYLISRPQIQPGIDKVLLYAENLYPRDLELRVINGQLSTNVKEPYIFDIDKNNSKIKQPHLLVIDTEGSIENYPYYNTHALATKNALVYPSKSQNGKITQTSVFYFREIKQNLTLNKYVYDQFVAKIKPYAPRILFFIDCFVFAFIFLFLFFGSLFWTLWVMLGLLILNFFVWLFGKVVKANYSYSDFYKMSLHAISLELIIFEINSYLKLPIPHNIIYLVWMAVILFNIRAKAVAKNKTK